MHLTLDTTVNSSAKANQIVLYSNVDTFSYQWLLAIPNAGLGQVMTPREFRAAVSLRLPTLFSQAETPCTALGCNGTADPFGYNVLSYVVEIISANLAIILFETHYMTYLVLRDVTPSKMLPCSVWAYLATSAFVQPIC